MGVLEDIKKRIADAANPAERIAEKTGQRGFMDFSPQAQYEARERAMNRANPAYQETKPTLIDNEVKKLPFPK